MDRMSFPTITIPTICLVILLHTAVAVADADASDIAQNTKADILRNGFLQNIGDEAIEITKDWVWVDGEEITFAATSTADTHAMIATMCVPNKKACMAIFSEYGHCREGDVTTLAIKTNLESRTVNYKCIRSSNGMALYGTKPEQVDDLFYYGSAVNITTQSSVGNSKARHFSLAGSSQALSVVFKAYERYTSSE